MSPDFSELLREFNARGVKYLVVGAHALAAYGHVRATKDFDVWIQPTEANAKLLMAALAAFGAPLEAVTDEDFATEGTVFQIGIPPLRIDVITAIDGVEFSAAWENRYHTRFGNEAAFVLSKSDLIKNKLAAGRLQDLADAAALESSNNQ
jgi:hypothetical protein